MSAWGLVTDNPIFVRELRRRMRGRGLITVLCLYVTSMCLWVLGTIHVKSEQILAQGFSRQALSNTHENLTSIGTSLFSSITTIQQLLVLIIAPTITAAMVRSEKERQTFDFLRSTALTAPTYVVGALMSTVLYVALSLFCALPVLMISHLYGGVSDLVATTFSLLGISVVLSCCGILISCSTERGRTGHVVLGGILAAGLAALYSRNFISGWVGGGTNPQTAAGTVANKMTLWGWPLPETALLWVGGTVLCVLVLIVASRKLFQPLERALNYRQLSLISLLVMAAVAAGIYTVPRPASVSAGSATSVSATLQDRIILYLAAILFLNIVIQTTTILSPVVSGNERWKVRQKLPWLGDADEAVLFSLFWAGSCAIVLYGVLRMAGFGSTDTLVILLPFSLYLVMLAGMCKWLRNRMASQFASLRVLVTLNIGLLLLPGVLLALASGLGTSPTVAAYATAVGCLSPLEAGNAFVTRSALMPAVLSSIIYASAACGAWLLALTTSKRLRSSDTPAAMDA